MRKLSTSIAATLLATILPFAAFADNQYVSQNGETLSIADYTGDAVWTMADGTVLEFTFHVTDVAGCVIAIDDTGFSPNTFCETKENGLSPIFVSIQKFIKIK